MAEPALKLADLPPNAYARLSELAVDFKLRVARPSTAYGLEAEARLVNAMLDQLADPAPPARSRS